MPSLDDSSRFWISKQVDDTKYTEYVRPLFQNGNDIAKKKPKALISDGARNFVAHKKEFWTLRNPRTKHIRHIHLKGDKNNNKREYWIMSPVETTAIMCKVTDSE